MSKRVVWTVVALVFSCWDSDQKPTWIPWSWEITFWTLHLTTAPKFWFAFLNCRNCFNTQWGLNFINI